MPELNFDALREAVENDTFLPEFTRDPAARPPAQAVAAAREHGPDPRRPDRRDARARHRRRRVHAHLPPGGQRPRGRPATSDGDTDAVPVTTPTAPAPTRSPRASWRSTASTARTRTRSSTCASTHACNLQLSQVNPTATNAAPQSVGLIRSHADAAAASTATGRHRTRRWPTSARSRRTARAPRCPSRSSRPRARSPATPRPVQISVLGAIRAVTGAAGTPTNIPSQPGVSGPDLVSTVHGWWVIGSMPDRRTRRLGQPRQRHDLDDPLDRHRDRCRPAPTARPNAAFATIDGNDMFVLARTAAGMKMLYSTDAGATWHPIADRTWRGRCRRRSAWSPRASGEVIASFTERRRRRRTWQQLRLRRRRSGR